MKASQRCLWILACCFSTAPARPPTIGQSASGQVCALKPALPGDGALGVRPAEATRAQLSQSFQELYFDPRPGYDHFCGWPGDPEIGVISREVPPQDGWVCLRRSGEELSSWNPPKYLPAPLEPPILPLLSGPYLMCPSAGQGAQCFRLNAHGKIESQKSLRRPQGLRVEQIASGTEDCLWVGRELTRKGQQRRVLGLLDREGQETWTIPLAGWSSRGFACLSLARDGQHCALLLDQPQTCTLQCLQLPPKQLFSLSQMGQPQSLAWVAGKLWLARKSTGRLVVEAYNLEGKRIWQTALADSADFQIVQIVAGPGGSATLIGSRQDATGARGLLVRLDERGAEIWRWSPPFDGDLLLKAARLEESGRLWVAGEVVEDCETDAFWGCLRETIPEKQISPTEGLI